MFAMIDARRSRRGTARARNVLLTLIAAGGTLAGSACRRVEAQTPEVDAPPAATRIDRQSVVTVRRERISDGPPISGELRAEHEATVRAQIGGSVTGLTVAEGQAVRSGQVLCRIEALAQYDAVASAELSVRSAENAADAARRDAERTQALATEGLVAQRDVEAAGNGVAAAEAQLADAGARLAAAREQLNKVVVRAPLSGVVSQRAANTGDVVAPGAPLMTIIDPSRMQLVASVPPDAVGALRVRAPVEFRMSAYGQSRFTGRIARISPAADPVTRQVQIYVSIPDAPGRLVAGLFAEGRVATVTREGLIAPVGAVQADGPSASVLRLRDGRAERVPVTLGLRDEQHGRVEIRSGVTEDDMLLTGPAQAITPGTRIEVGN